MRALWRSPDDKFPDDDGAANWEVWLNPDAADGFIQRAPEYGVTIGAERLEFPEDIVVIANGTRDALASAIRRIDGVRAMAAPTITADFFDGLDVAEQADWVDELVQRTRYPEQPDSGYITLFDTGVSRAHPLIQPSLSADDRHAANPAWGLEDVKGHGTLMAGLTLYGDLTPKLHQDNPVEITHRLESVKYLPDAGQNPHHLLGAVTRDAVNTVEQNHPRRRTFTMATTTGEDTPHDGAPTSWSSEIDQLVAGVSGERNTKRLMLISAGNSINSSFGAGNYLDTCDHEDNEIESPAQAWNALCVGAFTEKTRLPPGEPGVPVAPFGDLSPASRTASWKSHWPLKPDVVLEGGNWVVDGQPPPLGHGWLSLLSAHHLYPQMKLFSLPWPVEALRALGNESVTLRVTLSTFIAPNPSEASRGSRYRYASHNLRFKLNRVARPHPLTLTTCRSVCTTSIRSCWAAMTDEMSL